MTSGVGRLGDGSTYEDAGGAKVVEGLVVMAGIDRSDALPSALGPRVLEEARAVTPRSIR